MNPLSKTTVTLGLYTIGATVPYWVHARVITMHPLYHKNLGIPIFGVFACLGRALAYANASFEGLLRAARRSQ